MRQINLTTTHGGKAGWCEWCGQPFANLANHTPHCRRRDHAAEEAREKAFIDRAAAHATAVPHPYHSWLHAVTDRDVALVMYSIEAQGTDFQLSRMGQWSGARLGTGIRLHWVITEMIRTGLVRHVYRPGPIPRSALVPALVHLRGEDGWSCCHFTGEDLGPMRSRLVRDMALVDCLNCLAVAADRARGL